MEQKFCEFFTQANKESESTDQDEEENSKVETNTVNIDVLRLALGNDVIMENIVISMGLEDLDHWYEFCEKFQFHDLTNMDRIFWKKRAQKLAEIYKTKPLTRPIEEYRPEKTYRKMHTLIKNLVDARVSEIRNMLQTKIFNKRTDVVQAASFAYHGLLGLPGPHWGLRLSIKICSNLQNIEQDLSEIPTAHLAALKASVVNITVVDLFTHLFMNGWVMTAEHGSRPITWDSSWARTWGSRWEGDFRNTPVCNDN